MKKISVMLMVLGIMVGKGAWAADIYVPTDYGTIQAAIDAATTGDTVWVDDGIYTGGSNTNLSWIGKHITVRSVNGPVNCIINCQNDGRGFTLNSGQNSSDVINGFTIRIWISYWRLVLRLWYRWRNSLLGFLSIYYELHNFRESS
jgi:hypothetical protein